MAKSAASKTPSWGSRPTAKPSAASPSVEDFVNGVGARERINFYVPADLYKRVKIGCATEGSSMTDVLTELLEQRFPKP